MSQESAVSPIPEGSARHTDLHVLARQSAANSLSGAATDRAGTGALIVGTNSNWGLGGTDSGTLVLNAANGSAVYQIRGGAVGHEMRVNFVTVKPTELRAWRDGLYVFELVMAWPSDAVGADNGILWGFNSVGNLRPSVAQCFALMNDTAGVLNFVMRGPTGTQTTVLPGFTLSKFNKFRIEMRLATSASEGTMRIFVNDSAVPTVAKDTSDANFPAIGAAPNCLITMCVGCGSAVNFLHLREWSFWRGPNSEIGM